VRSCWFGFDAPAARIPARLCVCLQPDPSTPRFISGPHKTKCLRDAGSGRQRTRLVPGLGRGVPRLPPHHPSSTPEATKGQEMVHRQLGGRGTPPLGVRGSSRATFTFPAGGRTPRAARTSKELNTES
jgi:hypothetical protein